MTEIIRFFQDYKAFERKNVSIEHLLGKNYAHKVIRESLELYNWKDYPNTFLPDDTNCGKVSRSILTTVFGVISSMTDGLKT